MTPVTTPATDAGYSPRRTLSWCLNAVGVVELLVGICVAMLLTYNAKPCDLATCSAEMARTSTAFAIIGLSVFGTLLLFTLAALSDEYHLVIRVTRHLTPATASD